MNREQRRSEERAERQARSKFLRQMDVSDGRLLKSRKGIYARASGDPRERRQMLTQFIAEENARRGHV